MDTAENAEKTSGRLRERVVNVPANNLVNGARKILKRLMHAPEKPTEEIINGLAKPHQSGEQNSIC